MSDRDSLWRDLNRAVMKMMDDGMSNDDIIRAITINSSPEARKTIAAHVREIRRTQPGRSDWLAIVRAYRACTSPRPSQLAVAERLGFGSEDSVRDRLRALGIKSWHDVHSRVAAEPLDLDS